MRLEAPPQHPRKTIRHAPPVLSAIPHRCAQWGLMPSERGTGVADRVAIAPEYRDADVFLAVTRYDCHKQPGEVLHIDGGRMAFLYVDPFGRDLAALRKRMTERGSRAAFDLHDERPVIGLLADIDQAIGKAFSEPAEFRGSH